MIDTMKTLQQFQNEIRLIEAPAKAVVFMFGRFNPPTSGHERMVKRAVQVARRAGIRDVRLYPSFSQDPKRNPLAHKEKIKWLQKFFKGVKVVNDKEARSPFAAARRLSDQGMKRVIMVAGGDRVKEFQTKISKYIKHPDPDKSFEFDEFQVVSAGERDPDADDATGMSASKMRAMAAVGDFVNFVKGMPSRARDSDSSAMFDAIRRAMNLKESMSVEQSDAAFSKRLKDLESPDVAEVGKCYSVVWADGRGVVAYRNRSDAIQFVESGDRDVVSVDYRDAMRPSGRSLIVRNKFTPDRSTIGEEWPDTLETHDERLFRVNEDFEQLDETRTSSWWYNTRTRKSVEVKGEFFIHADVIDKAPEKLGLTDKDVLSMPGAKKNDERTRDFFTNKLTLLLKKKGWAQLSFTRQKRGDEAFIRTDSTREAQATLKWILNNFSPTLEIVFITNTKAPKRIDLRGQQISQFARTGKVVRVSPIAAFRDHVELDETAFGTFWHNAGNNKLVEVRRSDGTHVNAVRNRPKEFGLKQSDIPGTDIIELMKMKRWSRVVVALKEWNIETNNLRFAWKTAAALDKKFPLPTSRIVIATDTKDVFLEGNQIRTFIKTGKVVRVSPVAAFREALSSVPKWWYNTKTRKAVKIQENFHLPDVVKNPKRFGLTHRDVDDNSTEANIDSDFIPELRDFLFNRGWVMVSWTIRPKELLLQLERNTKKAQATLKWFLDNINPTPELVRIALGVGQGAVNLIDLFDEGQIKHFLRTGKPGRKRFGEALLYESTKQTKGWFDTKKNKLVELLSRDVNHDWAPINNPARFGLKRSDVAEFEEDMNDGQDEIFDLSDLMLSRGWVKLSQWEGINDITWNLNGAKLDQVHKAALGMQKKFRLDPDRIFIDFGPTGPRTGAGKFETLSGNQVKTFLRTGKIVKLSKLAAFRDHVELDEARDKFMWHNPEKNKFVTVGQNETHVEVVRRRPKEFGLKKSDIDLEIAGSFKLIEFMKGNKWSRITVRRQEWFIESGNLRVAKKTAKALDQKFLRPKRIFIEHGRSSVNVSGNQVKPFLQTGKIVRLSKLAAFRDHVELDEKISSISKWWYNSRTKKDVVVIRDFHVQQVLAQPERFDLTEKDLDSIVPARKRLRAPRLGPKELSRLRDKEIQRTESIGELENHLHKQGWVAITWSRRVNEAVFRVSDSKTAQKALNWYLNKINPTPNDVRILGPGTPEGVLRGSQIDGFAKTGKVLRVSPLAAFR